MSKLGVGWAREEYTYSDAVNFAPYDAAYSRLRAANIKILGLLTYSSGKSHAQWRTYVTSVVNHFPSVPAWEIMNEADNYLSPADYVPFLKEAHDIIKARNSSSKVILSGITARVESPNFWNGVAAAGGWGYFDAAGLHVFHNTDPYHDSYNNGTLAQEIQHAIDSLNHNGGGKKIWLSEFGWDSNKFGTDNQATWFSQGLPIVHNFSEVEKIFIFRMYDQGNGLGLLTSSFAEKPAFGAVKDTISRIISGQAAAPANVQTAAPQSANAPTSLKVSKEKSMIRQDELINTETGRKYFRLVVRVNDENGVVVKNLKPEATLEGITVEKSDFILVGDEWLANVTSQVAGQSTVKISAGSQALGTLTMSFNTPTSSTPPATTSQTTTNKLQPFVLVYPIGSAVIIGLLTFLYFNRRKFALK